MKTQVKELLDQFKYKANPSQIETLVDILSNNEIPPNQYAIKNFALKIQNHLKSLKLKKSHSIEIVSRVMFKEQWHKLSKKIPKEFKLVMNKRFIEYGVSSIDLGDIDGYSLIEDNLLVVKGKKGDSISIIHPEAKELFEFINNHTFTTMLERMKSMFNLLSDDDAIKILGNLEKFDEKKMYLLPGQKIIDVKKIYHKMAMNEHFNQYEKTKADTRWGELNLVIDNLKRKKKMDQLIVSENGFDLVYGNELIIVACYFLDVENIAVRMVSSKFLGSGILNPNYINISEGSKKK